MVVEKTISVQGMSCGHCKMSVEGALNELDGVSAATVDLEVGNVKVEYDEAKVSMKDMQEAIEDQGYDIA